MATPATKEDISNEELKLIGAIRTLGIKPEGVSSKEEFEDYMHKYETLTHPLHGDKRSFPRISTFFGEENKGDVNYSTWKYEIQCLVEEKIYPEETLLLAIRRSVRGEAADILRRLGTKANISEVLHQFHCTYGQIDSIETVLKKFYACEQGEGESFGKYCARVEELFTRAIELKALKPSQQTILKSVVYQGMKQPLKQMTNLKFELAKDYDDFKIEVRKIENETVSSKDKLKTTTTKCQSTTESKSEIGELKDLLKEMNTRIQNIEQDRDQQTQQLLQQQFIQQQKYPFYQYRGTYRGQQRGHFTRGTPQNRGRAPYRPTRPLGTHNFRPAYRAVNPSNVFRCYRCNKEGHIARNCQENL
jgi:hypothetical protein